MSSIYRVAYLVSHPIQYQAPLLRKIAAQPHIDLTAFFLSDHSVLGYQDEGFGARVKWDMPLLEGYKYAFLPVFGKGESVSFWFPWAYRLRKMLLKGQYDVLWVHGYFQQSILRAIGIAKAAGIKVLLRGESNDIVRANLNIKTLAKEQILPRMFARVDAFLAIGTANRDYYLARGVSDKRIFMMPYAVDNLAFQKKAQEAHGNRERLRAELGLKVGRPIILFASKFQRRKRAWDLLEAYIRLSDDGNSEPEAYLLFVGDGEEGERLKARAERTGWSTIRFLGFQNQSQLPKYFDLCDVFVLVSEKEPWGLVVNEVMNARKAVIVSDQVGCAANLVKDGQNGFVVRVGDVNMLAECLKQLTCDPEKARTMGEASYTRIRKWGFDEDVAGLKDALKYVMGRE